MSDVAQVAPVQQGVVFDPTIPRRNYTTSEWLAKEDFYVQQISRIQMITSPGPAEVQQAALDIDSLLSIARIDYAFVEQAYDKYSMQLKVEEKRLFVDLKMKPPAQYNTLKLTVDEMKGVVASVINNQAWAGTKYSLYELVEMSSARNIFMEGVIKILQDKKDLLITHSGILKIENSLSGMQSNAPNYQGKRQHFTEED